MAYRLEADESVRNAMLRCAGEQLDRAVSELSERISSDPVEAVHAARKAVKKERSLLRMARGSMPAKQRRRENAALREAAQGLSGARDAEAMIATLDDPSRHAADRGVLRRRPRVRREACGVHPADTPPGEGRPRSGSCGACTASGGTGRRDAAAASRPKGCSFRLHRPWGHYCLT